MKASMSMTIDTTWGNAVTLTVESDLDNGGELTTAQLSRLQLHTLSMMVAEVRRENDRDLDVRDREGEPLGPGGAEARRFRQMEDEQRTT